METGTPWRQIDARYEVTMLISPEWARAVAVEKNVEAVGFKDVKAMEKLGTWVPEDKNLALGCIAMTVVIRVVWRCCGRGRIGANF